MENCPLKTYRRGWETSLHRRMRIIMNRNILYLHSGSYHRSHGAIKVKRIHYIDSVVAHSSVFVGMEKQASTPDADMLVMAFQEIDHSTEAFFNFAGHARDEAWTVAILAALGDKAEQYEKVNFPVVTVGACS
jgi:hypothetical protein